jgi:hypothetical protein
MNSRSTQRWAQVIGCLLEGNSICAIVRMTVISSAPQVQPEVDHIPGMPAGQAAEGVFCKTVVAGHAVGSIRIRRRWRPDGGAR